MNLRIAAFQTVSYAAAKVFVEAAKNTSRQISRKALVDSLDESAGLKNVER